MKEFQQSENSFLEKENNDDWDNIINNNYYKKGRNCLFTDKMSTITPL